MTLQVHDGERSTAGISGLAQIGQTLLQSTPLNDTFVDKERIQERQMTEELAVMWSKDEAKGLPD